MLQGELRNISFTKKLILISREFLIVSKRKSCSKIQKLQYTILWFIQL